MKSTSVILAGGLAIVASATENYWQMSTVTVTQSCLPGQPGAPPAQYGASTVTVTLTETKVIPPTTTTVTSTANATPAPITITETTTVGGQGSSGMTSVADYHSLPPPPGVSTTYITTSTTTSPPSSGQTHRVDVGTFNGTVKFVPDNVNAMIGDVVEYNFLAKSHSLTQSEFLTPCTFNGGFDTGLNQSNPKNTSGLFVIPFPVKTTKPQWFYCKQPGPPNHWYVFSALDICFSDSLFWVSRWVLRAQLASVSLSFLLFHQKSQFHNTSEKYWLLLADSAWSSVLILATRWMLSGKTLSFKTETKLPLQVLLLLAPPLPRLLQSQ